MKNLYEYNTYLEILLLLSVLLLGGSGLWHDFKQHHRKFLPLILFLAGFAVLISGHLFFHDHAPHATESGMLDTSGILVIAGSLLLFSGQMTGIFFRRNPDYLSNTSL